MNEEEEKTCENCGTIVNGIRICPNCGTCCTCNE